MNNYYLLILDNKPFFMEIENNGSKANHGRIQDIDKFTMSIDLKELEEHLVTEGKINNSNSTMYIVHKNTFKGNNYINYMPILRDKNSKYNIIDKVDENNKIRVKDCKSIIISFFNKYKTAEFKKYTEYGENKIHDKRIRNMQIIYARIFKDENVLEEAVDYYDIRRMINILRIDEVFSSFSQYQEYTLNVEKYISHYKKDILDYISNDKTKSIYTKTSISKDKVKKAKNRYEVEGQIKFKIFASEVENTYSELDNMLDDIKDEVKEEYERGLDYYFETENRIKSTPFDSKKVEESFKGNTPMPDFSEMTLEDQLRIGHIDVIEYIDKLEEIKKNNLGGKKH